MGGLFPYEVEAIEPQAIRPANIDQVGAPSFWAHTKGEGAVIAIVDTGLDVNHPEFAGRIINPRNFTGIGELTDVHDVVGHGTHVAGIVAGASCGVAPMARIMPLKVFPDTASSDRAGQYIQEALLAIWEYNKSVEDKNKVVAVNCSFGAGVYDSMTAYTIRLLVEQGVTVVVAAGNSGDGDPETHEIFNYPAYIWECLTVGAINADNTSAVFSSSYDGIDIGAPGVRIYSSWPGGGYALLSGTSMACPHVTGAMALIYSAWRIREKTWPNEDQAFEVLCKHIKKVNLPHEFVGNGLLDLTWGTNRWPLYRVQLGAYYNKTGADTTQEQAKAAGLPTYQVKY